MRHGAGDAGVIDGVIDDAIETALAEVPGELRGRIVNLAILVADANDEDPDLLGLYEGVPLTERRGDGPDLPDVIHVYRGPLVDAFGHDLELLRLEVRITVLHELGHHFGLSEERLADLGWA